MSGASIAVFCILLTAYGNSKALAQGYVDPWAQVALSLAAIPVVLLWARRGWRMTWNDLAFATPLKARPAVLGLAAGLAASVVAVLFLRFPCCSGARSGTLRCREWTRS